MQFFSNGVRGFGFPFQGMAFLWQNRPLWKWALLPAAVNVVVFATAFAIFLWTYPITYSLITGFLPSEPPDTWYAWLWTAPLRFLAWMIGALLIVASIIMIYLAFLLLGTVIAAPFLDVLAQRVEDIATGQVSQERPALRGIWQSFYVSFVSELKKIGFFFVVQATLFFLGLIPILSPFTIMAATLFTMLFLPLQYAGYAMDHRLMTFAQRRTLVWKQRWLMLGFGAAASLTLLIPLLNFVCLPILVVGGTLLLLNAECGMRNAE